MQAVARAKRSIHKRVLRVPSFTDARELLQNPTFQFLITPLAVGDQLKSRTSASMAQPKFLLIGVADLS